MGLTALITVSGEKEVTDMFERFQKRVGAPEAALLEIAELIAKSNERLYGRGPQLAPATVASKQAKGQSSERLVATGEMKHQVTTIEGGVRLITSTELVFGTDKFYAKFAQFGTTSSASHTGEVRRRVLRFSLKERLAAVEILKTYIMGANPLDSLRGL
jgi:hypothetical protein